MHATPRAAISAFLGIAVILFAPTFVVSESIDLSVGDKLIEAAFGPDSPESRMDIKVHLRSRGIVLACAQADISENGSLCIKPFHFARLDGKNKVVERVIAEQATVRFDIKLTSFAEMEKAKTARIEATLKSGKVVVIEVK